MKRGLLFLSIVCTLLVTSSVARAFNSAHLWSRGLGGVSDEEAYSVAVDGQGNILVTGSFSGTVNLGGDDLVTVGSVDIFLAKYDAVGTHLWSKRFGSAGADTPGSVALDGSNNVVLAGSFVSTINFGAGNLVSVGGYDIFLAKFDSNGTHQWSKRFGSTGTDYGLAVAVDTPGNIIATGAFEGTVGFGGSNLVSAGSRDIFLARFDSAGGFLWSLRFGGVSLDHGNSVVADNSGNVLVTGYFNDQANFGGGILTSAGGFDIFLAKYNAAGAHQWSKRFGSTGSDLGSSLAVDDAYSVVLTGYFSGTVNFGGSSLVSAGLTDIFVAKYNASGTHGWSRAFGSTLTDQGSAVAVDLSGNVFLAGSFKGTVNFGGGGLVCAGGVDAFLAKYNSIGTHVYSRQIGNTYDDKAVSVATDLSGDLVVAGTFRHAVNFGGGNIVSAGGMDVFLARYGGPGAQPVIATIRDIGNDQGRRVNIRFMRSGGDDGTASNPVTTYEAYRWHDYSPSLVLTAPLHNASARALLEQGWTQVGTVAAHAQDEYRIEAPTLRDSTVADGLYETIFFIRAATAQPAAFYDSAIDSGYSVDNLAPGVPANFTYSTGELTWDESVAADFDFFTVYGSNTDSFGAATLVDYSVSPTMNVTASPYVYYFVTATDFSGNEGKPAKVSTISGVGGTPKHYVLSVSNYPNPFNPRTTVSYTVPSRGAVSISIYDTRGALVATLFNGERAPGAYSVEWDGRAEGASVAASGLYFARIEHASGTKSKKMVLLK